MAAREMYGRPDLDRAGLVEIADEWRPFRMWPTILLRMCWNRGTGPRSYRQPDRSAGGDSKISR